MIRAVVDMTWVEEHRDELMLADVRWYLDGRSGREAYGAGHLPGAVFADLDLWLAGDPAAGRGRHPLPDPETFALGMSLAGISDDSVVVAYDDQGGVVAARLVWMLRATGHEAALLDDGLLAYEGPLESPVPVAPRGRFTARPWPDEYFADIGDATDSSNVVLDARSRERFQGVEEPVDARAGHIPGARNLPCRENLDESARFLPVRVLRERFEAAGVTNGDSVVSYCGSGVTACHNLLAMELCGLGHGRLYTGSWSQYSQLRDWPVETGDPRPVI